MLQIKLLLLIREGGKGKAGFSYSKQKSANVAQSKKEDKYEKKGEK